jgi:nucleotide-binding universal stress UspA family protein
MFERILVGVDGSPHAAAALSAAEAVAKESGGEVRVVHVREISPTRGGSIGFETREETSEVVDEAVKELEAKGVKASGAARSALTGHVAAEIIAEAQQWNASVIVLATRGLTDLAGIVLGSTTHKVLHLGPGVPVLVVHS